MHALFRKVFPVIFIIMFVLGFLWVIAMFWTLLSMEPHELARLHCASAYNPQECVRMLSDTLEPSATE